MLGRVLSLPRVLSCCRRYAGRRISFDEACWWLEPAMDGRTVWLDHLQYLVLVLRSGQSHDGHVTKWVECTVYQSLVVVTRWLYRELWLPRTWYMWKLAPSSLAASRFCPCSWLCFREWYQGFYSLVTDSYIRSHIKSSAGNPILYPSIARSSTCSCLCRLGRLLHARYVSPRLR